MRLEDQVCGLESAKRLKELGVKQESLFLWNETTLGNTPWLDRGEKKHFEEVITYSAFTIAELGEILPKEILFENNILKLGIWKNTNSNEWVIFYENENENEKEYIFIGNEVESRAGILIYLLENKLIKLEEKKQ